MGSSRTIVFAVAMAAFAPLAAHAIPAASCAPTNASVPVAVKDLAPAAIQWAKQRAQEALASGEALSPELVELARAVGVQHPEKIRIQHVDRIELPAEPALAAAASKVGLVPASAGGMTLGHAVVIVRSERGDRRLLSHEFRHVAQFEACGGIAPFLERHLGHLAQFGYRASPFEADARKHERR